MKEKHKCPVCGKNTDPKLVHTHYLDHLEKQFQDQGFLTIREGKIPIEPWNAPDLFVLNRDLKIVKIVEVVVGDSYVGSRSVKEKASKIKDYYNPPEIIIFEPIQYIDKEYLPEKKDSYKTIIGTEPQSYTEVENYYADKWKKEGLDVIFWNEKHIR